MRILLINPNTSESVTDLVAGHVRRLAGASADFLPVTARFGARYIASRAALAIAGHAALDCLAEHVGESLGHATPSPETLRSVRQAPSPVRERVGVRDTPFPETSGPSPCPSSARERGPASARHAAEPAGYQAVYLACFGDPGLAALREISPVPVVGMVEASCRAAAGIGRFGIVTGGVLWEPILAEIVAALGLSDRFTGVRTIAPTGGEIARDPASALPPLVAAAQACAEDGAGAVILGGAALAGLNTRIQPDVAVPVLCSVEAGTRAVLVAAASGRRPAAPVTVESVGLGPALSRMLAAS